MGSDRDYYADLELSQTADITEIKKQFRKLGGLHSRWPLRMNAC
jgi:curved DNA-binding protein CbpA